MKKKVKILQVCAIDLSVDALLKPLVKASMEQGYEVHNACTDEGRFERLRSEGLTLVEVPVARRIAPKANLKTVWHLYKLMRKERYDIVHVHTPVAALLGRIAAKLARVPHVIYTAHGFYFHEGMSRKEYNFFYRLEKYFARFFTDWLLLQSREDYELCVEDRFKRPDKILHISNGVDIYNKFNLERIDPVRLAELKGEFGIRDEDIVFSFIGRFVREKGILELLEAFAKLRQERDDVKLLMIGDKMASERDQADDARLDELLGSPGVITPGFRKDVPDLVALSDIYCLPSYREGLPRSIIEAMAMHKPILATNIRGCREEVFHGENGYLVEKANWQDLYDRMSELAADQGKIERMGTRSRELVEELFNEAKVIQIQLDLFAKLSSK